MDSGGYSNQYQGGGGGRSSGYSLFVGGLAFNATEQDVRYVLAAAGNITNIRIVTDRETGRSKGFCFVDFDSQEGVDRAIRDYNGTDICGRPIRLDAGGKGKGKGTNNASGQMGSRPQYGSSYERSAPYGQSSGGYQSQEQPSTYGGRYEDPYKGGKGYGGKGATESSYNNRGAGSSYNTSNDASSYARPSASHYGGHSNDAAPYSRGTDAYRRDGEGQTYGSRPTTTSNSYGGRQPTDNRYQPKDNSGYRDRSRSRGRSASESSSTLERKKRERQAKKEQFSKVNAGWDRAPNSEELAQQEAERAAVRAAEAQGKDITTIRADMLKQAQWRESSNSYTY